MTPMKIPIFNSIYFNKKKNKNKSYKFLKLNNLDFKNLDKKKFST